nr:hypothetical protein [Tanacetum cinerariifolium]
MTTLTVTSSTDSQMHNNIKAAVQALAATDDSPAIPKHTTVETPMNMSPENKAHFQAEKEAIHLILTGIGDKIYSTVDACQKTQEIWEAIKRFYKLMNEMIRNNLTVATQFSISSTTSTRMVKKILNLISKYFKMIYKPTNNNLRTSSNSWNKNMDTTSWYKNDNQSGQFGNQRTVNVVRARENECRNLKRVKDSAYHKEKMLLCKQAEQGVTLQAEQYDWLADTDEEIDDQELEAHYSYMEKIQEIQKQLKKANTTLSQELKECKTILAETSKSLKESISVRDSYLVALQTKQAEFEKYKAFNDRTIDYDKLELKLNETLDQFRAPTAQDMEILLQTCLMPLAIKTQNDSFLFVHELKQEMHADLKNVESLEKEIDKLESDKVEFSNMYDMILQEYVSNDVKCSYLLSLSDLDA